MKVLKFFLFSHCCIGNWKGCHARVKIQEFKFPEKGNVCQAVEIEWKLSLNLAQQKCDEFSKLYIQAKKFIDWVA